MRIRNTLIAVIVLAVLAGLIWLDIRSDRNREVSESEDARLFDPAVTDISALEGLDLIRPDGAVRLRKESGAWRLTGPVEAPADEERLKAILSTLAALEVTGRIESPSADLAQYGLDPPALEIVASATGLPGAVRLLVGAEAPVGSARYARREGDPALLTISSSVGKLLGSPLDDLRYRKIVGIASWEVTSLSIEAPAGRVALERTGDGWRLSAPVDFPADFQAVSTRLFEIASLEAEGFAPPGSDAGSLGLGEPDLSLAVAGATGDPIVIRFARIAEGGAWAKRSDMEEIFRIAGADLAALELDPVALRDLRVAPVDRHAISEIRGERDGESFALIKDADMSWRWESEPDGILAGGTIEDLLDALDGLRAESVRPAGGRARAGAGLLSLAVGTGGSEPVRIAIHGSSAEGYTATTSASDFAYVLPGPKVEDFLERASAVRSLQAAASGQAGTAEGD